MTRPIVLGPSKQAGTAGSVANSPTAMPTSAASPTMSANIVSRTSPISMTSAPGASILTVSTGGFLSPGLSTGSNQPQSAGSTFIPYAEPVDATLVKTHLATGLDVDHVTLAFAMQMHEDVVQRFEAYRAECETKFKPIAIRMEVDKDADVEHRKEYKQVIVHLDGALAQVSAARSYLLRMMPIQMTTYTQAATVDLCEKEESKMSAKIEAKVNTIAQKHHVSIRLAPPKADPAAKSGESSLEIKGLEHDVAAARLSCLVLFDELAGLQSDQVEIESKLVPLVSGRQRVALEHIMRETGTNIYLPSMLRSVDEKSKEIIYVTGRKESLDTVKQSLLALAAKKEAIIIPKEVTMVPHKLEWVMSDAWESIRQIMDQTGCFIAFPSLGKPVDRVTVYGDKPALMNKAVTLLLALCATQIAATFFLDKAAATTANKGAAITQKDIHAWAASIAGRSGAEVLVDKCHLRCFGEEGDVLEAIKLAEQNPIIRAGMKEVKAELEMTNEHRDFLSGKKNGKMNKVMKASGAKVTFTDFNSINLLIDVASDQVPRVLAGLALLKDELPAEIAFHVPESAHKRIIGIGGKSIQAVMKQYGVYVKFSGADEFLAYGGMLPIEDNVVVRTPSKNGQNLYRLKESLMEMVYGNTHGPATLALTIPRRFHHWLTTTKHVRIADIEAKTQCLIRFPPRELGSAVVRLHGTETNAHQAAQMIKDLLPVQLDYAIPDSTELQTFLNVNTQWKEQLARLQHELEVWVTVRPSSILIDGAEEKDHCNLRMWTARVTAGFLKAAVAQVVEMLQTNHIPLVGSKSNELEPPLTPLVTKPADGGRLFDSALVKAATPAKALPGLSIATVGAMAQASANAEPGSPTAATPLSAGGSIKVQNISSGLVAREVPVSRAAESWVPPSSPARRRFSPALSPATAAEPNHGSLLRIHSTTSAAPMSPQRLTMSPIVRRDSTSLRSPSLTPTRAIAFDRTAGDWRRPSAVPATPVTTAVPLASAKAQSALASFLHSLDLEKWTEKLAAQDVDYGLLLTLSEDDLKELGVTFGARRKIVTALADLKSAVQAAAPRKASITAVPATLERLRPDAKAFQPIPGFPKMEERVTAHQGTDSQPKQAAPNGRREHGAAH